MNSPDRYADPKTGPECLALDAARQAVGWVDSALGEGYAKANPALVFDVARTAVEFAGLRYVEAIEQATAGQRAALLVRLATLDPRPLGDRLARTVGQTVLPAEMLEIEQDAARAVAGAVKLTNSAVSWLGNRRPDSWSSRSFEDARGLIFLGDAPPHLPGTAGEVLTATVVKLSHVLGLELVCKHPETVGKALAVELQQACKRAGAGFGDRFDLARKELDRFASLFCTYAREGGPSVDGWLEGGGGPHDERWKAIRLGWVSPFFNWGTWERRERD